MRTFILLQLPAPGRTPPVMAVGGFIGFGPTGRGLVVTDPETSQPTWPVPPPGPSRLRNLRLPLLVGLLSLALTGWLWHHENQAAEARMQTAYDFSVRQSVSRIEETEQKHQRPQYGV